MKASARAIEAAWEARNAFAANDEPRAFTEAVRAVSLGDESPDVLDIFRLLGAAFDAEAAAALLGQALEDTWGDWRPAFHAEVAALRFDRLRELGADPQDLAPAAVAALEAAAGGGKDRDAWAWIADPDRREALLAAAGSDPAAIADALEHLAFAPRHAGLQSDASRFAEQSAYAHAADRAVVRAAEVLLYAITKEGGPEATAAREAAKRLETMRKGLIATAARTATPASPPASAVPDITGACIVLVGGHDGLRAAVRALLAPRKPREIRDLPPSWEGQRGGGVDAAIRGADLTVLIIRQLDHSTGDAAEAAAETFGVAHRRARTASTAAIVAAIDGWAASR